MRVMRLPLLWEELAVPMRYDMMERQVVGHTTHHTAAVLRFEHVQVRVTDPVGLEVEPDGLFVIGLDLGQPATDVGRQLR